MHILIISFSEITRDPRVFRQINALCKHSTISVCGYGSKPENANNFYQIKIFNHSPALRIKRIAYIASQQDEKFYWSAHSVNDAFSQLKKQKFDLIFANELNSLPLAIKLGNICNAKVIADFHEYEPEQGSSLSHKLLLGPYSLRMLKKFAHRCSERMTVCEGIAEKYKSLTGLDFSVMTNATNKKNLSPSHIDPKNIRLIHHGYLAPDRNIDKLLVMLKKLDSRFSLDLVLLADKNSRYFKTIEQMVSRSDGRARIIEPFQMENIAENVNEYDLGVCMLNATLFSKRMALPNKFFEWIQARLGVISWPLPEMKRIIDKYQLGQTSDTFTIDAMCNTLNKLSTDDIANFKKNACKAADEINAEANADKLCDIIFNAIS